jgi:hypothetical protein
VSFDTAKIGDTQVYDAATGTKMMWFLTSDNVRITDGGYTNSAAVFVEVEDPDQNENVGLRERIDGYWDHTAALVTTGQNWPFGPSNLVPPPGAPGPQPFVIPGGIPAASRVNYMLGVRNIFNPGVGIVPVPPPAGLDEYAKLYVLNPRSGLWAAVDLLETGVNTGIFRSTICIDLVSQWPGVPTLGVIPGDTIIAVYQDPSNHSDVVWNCIKVGCGGSEPLPSEASQTEFARADGTIIPDGENYTDADDVYVRVDDPSHSGALLSEAVEINGELYDLNRVDDAYYLTDALTLGMLGVGVGDTITATYTDPSNSTDTSSDTISIEASQLSVTRFVVSPNPFETTVVFSYEGTGIAARFTVEIRDLTGRMLALIEDTDTDEVTWDGLNDNGEAVGKGAYIYVVTVENADRSYTDTGKDVLVRK